jgi:DNA-binding CsgD family transcriptional regulator
MRRSGMWLSDAGLRHLTRAAETLHDPFGFGTLDGWRAAVNERLREIVRADLGIFFVRPGPEDGAEQEPIFSGELSRDQRADFVRYALFDAGTDRALAFGLSVVTQRRLVGDAWDLYHADAAVNAFYLPNHVGDSIGFVLWDREGRKEASVELHREDFGTPLFGEDGEARLALLLPAFRAGVAAIRAAQETSRGAQDILDAVDQPLALADARGRLTIRSRALGRLIEADAEGGKVWSALGKLASSQSALFEARGWGRRHRTAEPCLEAALAATAVVETRSGRYVLSAVEAPAALTGGRHGFLLRAEPMFVATLTPQAAQARFGLTPRELHVARLLAAGARNEAIAAALGISPHTARRHTEKVFAKLGVSSRAAVGPVLRGEHAASTDPPPVH